MAEPPGRLTAAQLAAAERRAWLGLATAVLTLVVVVLMVGAMARGAWPEAIFWLLVTRGLPVA